MAISEATAKSTAGRQGGPQQGPLPSIEVYSTLTVSKITGPTMWPMWLGL